MDLDTEILYRFDRIRIHNIALEACFLYNDGQQIEGELFAAENEIFFHINSNVHCSGSGAVRIHNIISEIKTRTNYRIPVRLAMIFLIT
jgi:hypothetical protein